MGNVRIKYFVKKRQKAHTLYYWQPTKDLNEHGFLTQRLSNDESEAIQQAQAFNKELDDWRAGKIDQPGPKPGTLDWLINKYQTSEHFYSLRETTRDGYVHTMTYIAKWAGDAPIEKITRQTARAFLEAFNDKTRTKRAIYVMARILYNFARDIGAATENPFENLRIKNNPPRTQMWTEEEQDAFYKAALEMDRPSIAIAMVLAAESGQRETDLLKLSWTQYDGKHIKITQSKTGARVFVPVTERLKSLLDSTEKKSIQIIVSEITKKPYQPMNFRHLFKKAMDRAGIDRDKQFRDLRRTAVMNLALAGCSIQEISAITGHDIDKAARILEVYLPRDIRLAESAIVKLEKYREAQNEK